MAKYKYYSWMTAFIMGMGIMSYKPVMEAITEKPVNKTVTLAIYKDNDYSSRAYNFSYVQVEVRVEKVNGSNKTVELDTTFTNQLLKDYPTVESAQLEEITIPKVFAKKEKVKINYILTYYTDSSQLQMQNSIVLKNEKEHLNIGI